MGPKVRAAAQFARDTQCVAVIGSLLDIDKMFAGTAGTVFSTARPGVEYRP